jgi:hypothetical protein
MEPRFPFPMIVPKDQLLRAPAQLDEHTLYSISHLSRVALRLMQERELNCRASAARETYSIGVDGLKGDPISDFLGVRALLRRSCDLSDGALHKARDKSFHE